MRLILVLCIVFTTDAYCKRASKSATSDDIFNAPTQHAVTQGSKATDDMPVFGEEPWSPEGDKPSTDRPQAEVKPDKKKGSDIIDDAAKKAFGDEQDKAELLATDVIGLVTLQSKTMTDGQILGVTKTGTVDQNNDKENFQKYIEEGKFKREDGTPFTNHAEIIEAVRLGGPGARFKG